MKRTPLFERHRALHARIVEFAGFEMPIQYSGIIDEHRTVRSAVGLFDVSHMGEYVFRGAAALESCRKIFTNDPARLADGEALYTVACRENGGIVDDCVVYRRSVDDFLVVVNASNIEKDGAHFRDVVGNRCEIVNESEQTALIAVQGPKAVTIVESLSDEPISPLRSFCTRTTKVAGAAAIVSRSGYTGEDGVEIFCPAERATSVWDALMEAGLSHGIKPCGLGARDTLRLEAKLCLYGMDIDETTSPLEAGLAWVVKSEGPFVGREALQKQREAGVKRRLVCLVMIGRGIARHGMNLHVDAQAKAAMGVVTSGAPSPTLGKNIALGYLPTELTTVGTRVYVDVRGKRVEAEVIKGPFYKRSC